MRRSTPPRERRGGTCPPARPGGSFFPSPAACPLVASAGCWWLRSVLALPNAADSAPSRPAAANSKPPRSPTPRGA